MENQNNAVKPACAVKPVGSYNKYWQEKSRYRPIGNYTPVPADFDLENRSFNFSDNRGDWPWTNDPCSVLYNEKDGLYYSWMLYRDKTSNGLEGTDWMEMVSKDCINWQQTEKRLIGGVHAQPLLKNTVTFMGGSAWVDKENRFGFGAGAVLFMVSMLLCRIGKELGSTQSVALFVAPGGLGTPVDTSKSRFIFHISQRLTDWRDPRMQWDADNSQLIFAISNHDNIMFYVNKTTDINRFELTQTLASGYDIGIECPDFRPVIDSATGEKYWLLIASKQSPNAGMQNGIMNPRQTILWYLGRWNGKAFTPLNRGVLEYGHDFYAQSVSEPTQNDNPYSFVMRGYLGNWSYTPKAAMPQKGFLGGCFEDRQVYVEDGIVKVRPLIKTDGIPALGVPPLKTAPTWIKAKLADTKEGGLYALQWDSGDSVALDIASAIRFDTSKSGDFVLPGKGFAPLPVGNAAEMELFLNGCCLSVYVNGKQAGFQIFPRGRFTGLKRLSGAAKVKTVTYYDMSRLFA